ncbi:hypothetical protein G6F59_015784 [Rhizopus arrhizus]|nr:hypothetical protein G6F59_015784 [Rhizopus arrhizus]
MADHDRSGGLADEHRAAAGIGGRQRRAHFTGMVGEVAAHAVDAVHGETAAAHDRHTRQGNGRDHIGDIGHAGIQEGRARSRERMAPAVSGRGRHGSTRGRQHRLAHHTVLALDHGRIDRTGGARLACSQQLPRQADQNHRRTDEHADEHHRGQDRQAEQAHGNAHQRMARLARREQGAELVEGGCAIEHGGSIGWDQRKQSIGTRHCH